ncbi:TadE/TadG family type IV pilus assembly protein [Paenibacillus sp. MBLB4367]|uniref:TadE/TadG family type IV pilus assembly protein n=1 Tax=Paenibacillus sp. MBLB4367 TaxID=3384767 RepID=UPI0039080DC2
MKGFPGRAFVRSADGGAAVEAAVTLPFFLMLVLALHALLQISIVGTALQTSLSDTTQTIAANMYPVELLYVEAKSQVLQSRPAQLLQEMASRIMSARSIVTGAERLIQQYAAFIPDALVELVKIEQTKREQMEAAGQEQVTEAVDKAVSPIVNKAFAALVLKSDNAKKLKADRLKVVKVTLPEMGNHGKAFIGIEAEYEYVLPIPFVRKTVVIAKSSFERTWVGN